jgi:hypothetical protein
MPRGTSNRRQEAGPAVDESGTWLAPRPPREVLFLLMMFEEAPRNPPEASAKLAEKPLEHHSVYCPTCSHRLTGYRCKLICRQCGYYLSCADYY